MLDSAILYEYLKPVTVSLRLENDQLLKENLALRVTNELYIKRSELDWIVYNEELKKYRKVARKNTIKGFVLGAIISIIIVRK